jgi:iron(III) transport system ATP-binding protein
MAAITIRGLSKSYTGGDGPAAVSDLSLDIADGQFVTLLGPSGCGKTTTLRLIAGFIKPDAGTIHADARLVSSPAGVVPPEERGMGMVFQNYAVWPHKTVYENIAFGLRLRKVAAREARTRVESALSLVNLTGLEDRLPSELSGGQQQRVALARSLVVEPGILLLDEPLSNLDAKLRERMRTELKELQRRTGITFVYVTHDQAEALALSDKIAVIHGGRLMQLGTPREVYGRPASRVVADFMGLVNLLPGTVLAAQGHRATVRIGPDWSIELDTDLAAAPGEAVEIAVRPESIRLHPAARGDATGLPARIVEATFLGNIVDCRIALDDNTVLRVQAHPLEELAAGDAVTVHVDPAHCTLFAAAAPAGPEKQGADA